MRYKNLALAAVVGSIVMAAGLVGNAASSLSSTLTGFSGNTTQAGTQADLAAAGFNAFSTTAAAIAFDSTGAVFGTLDVGDGGRNYLRTTVSDYITAPFVVEITFVIANNDQAVFIGVGSGDTALFGTPDWSTQLTSASFWPEAMNDKFVRFRTANDMNMFADSNVAGGLDPGTHRFRITFDPGANTLLGEIDKDYAGGSFVADAVTGNLPISTAPLFAGDGWPSEPSRIFFGGDDGATFRDLSITVIPEPGAAALAVIGLIAAGARCFWKRS